MRRPRAYTLVEAYVAGIPEPFMLCWIPERGFVEPITNQRAEPVIGGIVRWNYPQE